MYYASRTGTRRNLAAMKEAGWGLLISAAAVLRDEGFEEIVLDNGKWTAHTTGQEWDEARFMLAVELFGHRAQWLVLPDIVADGAASLELSLSWLPRLRGKCQRLLIAVQDGMEPEDILPYLAPDIGIFLGGSTAWKLKNMQKWGKFCALHGVYYHVARVNTARRILAAVAAGADSVDGSSGSRFAVTIPVLQAAMVAAKGQKDLFPLRRVAV